MERTLQISHRSLARALGCAVLGVLALGPFASTAGAATTLAFTPEADTYVDSSIPNTSYGSDTGIWVDGSPTKHGYLRFRVSGLGGRPVLKVRLRMYQRDSSPLGGRVFSISSNSWAETVNWNTRPAIDGPQRGAFGAVQAGAYYEADLGSFISSDGPVSLAVDSTSADGVRWGAREYSQKPQLLVDVDDSAPVDGLSQVAAPDVGSSDPTQYSMNHRLAKTASGRLLTAHGRHATGVQLAWRDPGGIWQNKTTGMTSTGLLLSGTGTGDWPASIALARDSAGVEHAWIVWGRNHYNHTNFKFIQMARLSDLDSPNGPTVGPVQTIDAAPLGPFKPDLAFETTASGGVRGSLVWTRKTGDTAYEIVTAWFTDRDAANPVIHDQRVLHTATSSSRYGTLVPTPSGMRLVARANSGRLMVFSHAADAPLSSWTAGATGVNSSGYMAATHLDSGQVLAAVESDTTNRVVSVQRFSSAGAPAAAELQLTGYIHPTVASDGARAWLVMVRLSDGYVVSREYTPAAGWSASDRVEVGAEGGGNLGWPNAIRRTDGRLRFVLRGPVGPTKSSVLAFQRPN